MQQRKVEEAKIEGVGKGLGRHSISKEVRVLKNIDGHTMQCLYEII